MKFFSITTCSYLCMASSAIFGLSGDPVSGSIWFLCALVFQVLNKLED
ncbi:hypothetical protein FDJ56_gp19 [Pectobacterium phage vB_PatP_CB5]|uniref:Putative membrane protein n=1 Tax=Pectobacterium phage vB_PatP_CB5 TaxID=1983582 RepID=A0A2U7NMB4_9CAUD|nr:hypothetical protein FDJ56_gp19 [Pectobacterium phage vB_PatP_CB5]ARW58992.1 putative membrane protein [Pectobacterium phage vB_PatP_CB5]